MDSWLNEALEGAIIYNSNGRRIIRGGKEYPLSDEELNKLYPVHKDSGCQDCSFVQDKQTLFTFIVPRELKERATKRPSFVGMFTMPDWAGHSAFYLFKCRECDSVSVDYPHGYTSQGRIFLRCDNCREKLVLHPFRNRDIYKRDKIHIPTEPSFLKQIKNLWKNRPTNEDRKRHKALISVSEKIEQKYGVRVINNPYIMSDPKNFSTSNDIVQNVDSISANSARFINNLRAYIRGDSGSWIILFLLLAYALIYVFRSF